ncbi:TetR/AcrR family transcriptional regulator [Tersicoccus sp. MR15.9]|uniref:TetR/AcrR family transcriptional regulator n=1 Tax=Tersicoccus mangrovi TaxID=3121635 RepID=UPI002FE6A749
MTDSSVASVGRPRDADLGDRILTATQDLLIERGYAGTTVEDVARAAGTGKAAVYRRWASKVDLVVAAVRVLSTPGEVPDTGTLRGDLLACAMHYARPDARGARVLASLLGELGRDAELYEAARVSIGEPPVAALAAVLTRWVERGAVTTTAPIPLLAGIVPAVAFGQVTLQRRALDEATVVDLVDHVLLPALGASTTTER